MRNSTTTQPDSEAIDKMRLFLRAIKHKVGAKMVFAGYLPDRFQPMWKVIVDTDKTIMLDLEFSKFFSLFSKKFVKRGTVATYYASTVAIFSIENGLRDKRFTVKVTV